MSYEKQVEYIVVRAQKELHVIAGNVATKESYRR